jgi:hypothetical protein
MSKNLEYSNKEFGLGITMAGAISAGAYTAGVLDVLLASLLKQSEAANPDALRVILKAMSGTSAGGACTALSIPALIEGTTEGQGSKPNFDILYQAWVKEIDLLGGQKTGLVSLSDLREGGVRSVLNSKAIEEAVGRLLDDVHWDNGASDFIARDLDLFITCTSLNGVTYKVPFSANNADAGHEMADHAFVAHFRVKGLGTHELGSDWLDIWKDVGVPLSLETPGRIDFDEANTLPFDKRWSLLREMGVVTGAFPIGLSPQDISVTAGHFGVADPELNSCSFGGAWPLDVLPSAVPVPMSMAQDGCSDGYAFVGVDGGVCNNEPFEYARFTLRDADTADPLRLVDNPRGPAQATRAVIMIDPFPEGPETEMLARPVKNGRLLTKVVGKLVAAVRQQVRFKPSELVMATQEETRSRFLIAPSSNDGRGKLDGMDALASGLLEGFGGFLDEQFRQYDYDLGRHNAHSFLSKHFKLQTPHGEYGAIGSPVSPVPNADPSKTEVLILPPPSSLGSFNAPEWPRISNDKFFAIAAGVERRVAAVADKVLKENVPLGGLWKLAKPFLAMKVKKELKNFTTNSIGAALTKRDQLSAFEHVSAQEREVLSAMMSLGEREALLLADIKDQLPEDAKDNCEDVLEEMVRVTPQPMYSVRKSGFGKPRYKLRLL